MAPLHVAIAILRYFPHGGLQRIALAAAEALCRRGHRVDILTLRWEGAPPMDGITVREVPVRGWTNHGRAAALGRFLEAATGYDSVLGFDRLPGLDLYFAGDPCFAARIKRTRGRAYELTPRYRSFRRLEAAVFTPGSRTHILLMNGSEEEVFRREYGTPRARFTVLPPGFDPSRARDRNAHSLRQAKRAELCVGDQDHLWLCLGSDFHRKGFDRAVRAAAQAAFATEEAIVLAVAGRDRPAELVRLATSLGFGPSLRILGPTDEVPALLQAADLLLHPSRSEPAGMVLLESLSAGTPVVTTEQAGYARHVAASGAGTVIPEPFEQGALDTAVQALMERPRGSLGTTALAFMESVPPGAMIQGVVAALEARKQA